MRRPFPFVFNRFRFVRIALLAALIGSAVSVTPVRAAGIVVNTEIDETTTNGSCSLREAITNANDDATTYADCAAGSGADTITFAGDYIVTLQGSQLPLITSEITIAGNGADKTILQASTCNPVTLPGGCTPATYRVFELSSPGNLTLDQVSVRHGRCWGFCNTTGYTGSDGGGIFFSGGALTVTNSNFSGNWAAVGGGIGFLGNDGKLTITDSTFSGNFGYDGAGINFQDTGYFNLQSTLTVANSIFSGNSGRALRLSGGTLTVMNSTFSDNSTGYDAGISNTGTAIISDSTFSRNSAIRAGAIGNYGTLTVINSTFTDNSATEEAGGAIVNSGTLTVRDSTFSGNSAQTQGGAIWTGIWGGGVPSAEVTNSIFTGNSAASGGAIYSTNASGAPIALLTVTDSNFSENSAIQDAGGGISLYDHADLSVSNSVFSGNSATTMGGGISTVLGGRLTLTDSTLSGNTAGSGGGLYFELSKKVDVIGSTFNGNSATTLGGGIHGTQSAKPSIPIIVNSTFSENKADLGGGLALFKTTLEATNSTFNRNSATTSGGGIHIELSDVTLTNTIVANSLSGDSCAGGIKDGGHNLDSGTSCKWGTNNGSLRNTDPKLGPLGVHGGPTPTHALLGGSPAIDKGDDAVCSASPVNSVDQQGTARPQGDHCDIGAYEYQGKNGSDTTGVFRPSNGLLYLKNKNESGFADIALNYGMGGDYPIVGDWDGDGTDTIGVYRDGTFYLRNENTNGFAEIVFAFGMPGDQPIAGDWNGDGVDTIGVLRNGTFYLRNSNDAGTPDVSFGLGNPGDVGIAGDWDGDGTDTTGVFRPSDGLLYLKNSNDTGFADIALNYGLPGDRPVTGDWDNDGTDTIGVYRDGTFYLRNVNTNGFAELIFSLGNLGDMPIVGNWDGIP